MCVYYSHTHYSIWAAYLIECTIFYTYRDRFRTTVNVLGDSFGARIVERLSRKQLASRVAIYDGAIGGSNDTTLHSSGNSSGSKSASNSNGNDEEMELHETHTSTPQHNTTKL